MDSTSRKTISVSSRTSATPLTPPPYNEHAHKVSAVLLWERFNKQHFQLFGSP